MRGGLQQRRGHYGSSVPIDLAEKLPCEHSRALSIAVLFTTVAATLDALHEAAGLAHQLRARIEILIPYVVPYPLPIDKSSVDPEFRMRGFIATCEQQAVATQINIWLCRDARECIQQGLLPNSLVLIGGRQNWWPLTYERRLARMLKNAGHEVVLTCRS